MKNFWKKAAAGICAAAMLAVSAASTGLTANAVKDPYTGWEYSIGKDAEGNPSFVDLLGYEGFAENLTVPATFTIPDTSITVPVKGMPDGFLCNQNHNNDSLKYLKKVTFNAATTYGSQASIPGKACEECVNLKEVNIAVPISLIRYNAFYKCFALEKINLPNGLKTIEGDAFGLCTSLEHIVFPSTLETIGHDAFAGCTALQNVYIPYSVTEIGDDAFKNTKLTRVVVYNPNTNIANSAFPANVKQFCAPAEATNLQTYAESHGIPYLPFSLGNVNHDDRIDTKDVNMVLRAYTYEISGLDSGLSEVQKLEADINGNGKIDVRDSRLLLKYYTEVVVLHGDMSLPDYLLTQN